MEEHHPAPIQIGMFSHIFPLYDQFFKWYGFAESRLVRACGVGSGGTVDVPGRFMTEAEEPARAIVAGKG